jgi:hypothetical protein
MGDIIDDLIQKSVDIPKKALGVKKDLPTISPPPEAEAVSTVSTAGASLRARKRKGIAASVLAGQGGTGKKTLG